MSYTIAFCGVDGAGKSTLINKFRNMIYWDVRHQNKFMKKFYNERRAEKGLKQPKWWEQLNVLEVKFRNHMWKKRTKPLIMDRCYICGLVYSSIEGNPEIVYKQANGAIKPDVIVLLEPCEEIVPRAYEFTKTYREVLEFEGYEMFRKGSHIFGRVTFWKQPETELPKILKFCVDAIGTDDF